MRVFHLQNIKRKLKEGSAVHNSYVLFQYLTQMRFKSFAEEGDIDEPDLVGNSL